MARPEIVPFSEEHLADAGRLLAARHRRQRAIEPRLPERFEDPDVARAEVEELWRRDGASGTVALADGRAAGFLLGTQRDATWGPNVWVELAGQAVEEAELARDLYGAAAARWVDEGRHRH